MSERLPTGFIARWHYALKPGSWSKLFVPAFFGQCLGAAHLRRFDLVCLAAGMALTFLMLAFVVLMNDFADREVDAIKRRMFPQGCS
ncbi:MAG: prenyltransferase, partial [Myxococcales bacterium]|nr:prenyltransferase [Myxococcales bacterium]